MAFLVEQGVGRHLCLALHIAFDAGRDIALYTLSQEGHDDELDVAHIKTADVRARWYFQGHGCWGSSVVADGMDFSVFARCAPVAEAGQQIAALINLDGSCLAGIA